MRETIKAARSRLVRLRTEKVYSYLEETLNDGNKWVTRRAGIYKVGA